MITKNTQKIILHTGIVLCLILFLVFIGVFSYINSWRWLDSDHASEMILGKLLAEENVFVSKNWYYSTEIRLIYQTIFTMPLFKIFGQYNNWVLIRSINIMLNNLVLIISYVFLMKQFKINIKWILLTSFFLLMPLSYDYWNIVTFGGYYIFFIAQVFFCLGLFVKIINHNGTVKKSIFPLVLLSLFLLTLSAQTIRGLFIIHIPLLITCIFMQCKITGNKFSLLILGVCNIILGGAGYFINNLLQSSFSFSSFDYMRIEHLGNFFQKFSLSLVMLANFFGISSGMPVFSAFGVFSVIAIVATFVLFYYVFGLTKKYSLKPAEPVFSAIYFLIIFFASAVVFNIFVFTVSDRSITFRFFFPFMVLYVPLVAVLFDHHNVIRGDKNRFEITYNNIKNIAIICGILLFIFGRGYLSFRDLSVRDINSHRNSHIEYLLENNLEFGFATFWNANIITELTNGKIKMTRLDQATPGSSRKPFVITKSLIPVKFIDPSYHKDESFVLLTRSEWDMARNRLGSSVRLTFDYEDNNFIIIRFPSAEAVHRIFLE
jgi:hypothetical protein